MRGFDRSRQLNLQRSRRAAVDKNVRASDDASNQVARRSVDDGQRRISEDRRNPDDLDLWRVHEDEYRKAIVRIGVAAVARGIRIDPYTRRPVHVRSTAHQRQRPILGFAGPPIPNRNGARKREQSRRHQEQQNPHFGERFTIWLHGGFGYPNPRRTSDNPGSKDASESQRARQGGAERFDASTAVSRLEPAAHASLVVPIGVAEPRF
jgi:hypothetical protein